MSDLPLLLLTGSLIVLLVFEKISADLSSLVIIVLLFSLGYLTSDQALSGFSSPTVFTTISMFFITGALRRTGVANRVGDYLYKTTGRSEIMCIVAVTVVASLVSSFMNNLAAAMLLMPAVVALSEKSRVSSSKLLMPMSFGVIIGGMNTLIGTTSNILAADLMKSKGYEQFGFFEFTPFGLVMTAFMIFFFVFIASRMLPTLSHSDEVVSEKRDLAEIYRLHERLFTLKIPEGSSLQGKSLLETRFGETLGVTVDTIIRGGDRIEFPTASEKIYPGDKLVVQGRINEFQAIQRLKGVNLLNEGQSSSEDHHPLFTGAIIEFKDKSYINKTIKELNLREKFQFEIIRVERSGKFLEDDISEIKILSEDRLHIITAPELLQRRQEEGIFTVHDVTREIREFIPGMLHFLSIDSSSAFCGVSIKDADLGKLARISILSVVRGNEPIFGNLRNIILQQGDRILIATDQDHLRRIVELAHLEIVSEASPLHSNNSHYVVTEAVLAPRSWLIGRTIEEINFRDKYQCHVLAIWRKGEPTRSRISKIRLEFGDTLLLLGDPRAFSLLKKDTNFVLLFDSIAAAQRENKAVFAVISLFLLVGLSAFNITPVFISAMIAALFAVITGAIQMDEGYKDIDWKIITLIGCMIALGHALEHSTTLTAFSHFLTSNLTQLPPAATYFSLALFASIVCQLFDSTFAMIFMFPIAVATGVNPEVSYKGAIMSITLGSSMVFMSPQSHRAHLLVMGVGGYKPSDFFKIGTIFTFFLLLIITGMVSLMY